MRNILKKIIDRNKAESDPETIYHYTSIDCFKSIVEKSELWLTNVLYMNDKMEYIDYLVSVADSMPAIKEKIGNNTFIDLLQELYDDDLATFNKSPQGLSSYFMFSTCSKNDYIPMWNYYSDRTGICLEFHRADLDKYLAEFSSISKVDFVNYSCIYDKDVKKKITQEYLQEIVETYGLDKYDDWRKIPQIKNTLLKYAWIFKNSDFEYEKEHRYVFKVSDALKRIESDYLALDFSSNNISLKPILKLIFQSKLPIKKVFISPLNKNETLEYGLKRFLEFHEYTDIDVVQSKNSLRQI